MKIIYETLSVSTYLLGKTINENKRARGETGLPYFYVTTPFPERIQARLG